MYRARCTNRAQQALDLACGGRRCSSKKMANAVLVVPCPLSGPEAESGKEGTEAIIPNCHNTIALR
jgi:hypothetical protein